MPERDVYQEFTDKLFELDTGDRTALKRSAGKPMEEADGAAIMAFYRAVPYGVRLREHEESKWFAVACLVCLQKEKTKSVAFEKCLAALGEGSDSFEKKVSSLLDSDWDARMIRKLFGLAKMMKQKDLHINHAALLDDLLKWERPDRRIQKKWARAYSRAPQDKEIMENKNGGKENVD